jgi:hypothetical protein
MRIPRRRRGPGHAAWDVPDFAIMRRLVLRFRGSLRADLQVRPVLRMCREGR